jgi:hypothetical protein
MHEIWIRILPYVINYFCGFGHEKYISVSGAIVAMARSVVFEEVYESNTEELSREDLELEKHSVSLCMDLHPFGPWPLFGFLNPIHSR